MEHMLNAVMKKVMKEVEKGGKVHCAAIWKDWSSVKKLWVV